MPEPDSIVETSSIRQQLESFDDDDDPVAPAAVAPPVREGLPPGFRMRADAHYVDQLDTRMSSIPVRLIDTQSLDAAQHNGDAVTQAFVDSVKLHGVLQPLLVSARGSRYRVIAGRRRLAAAMAAGLRDVPCLVQHVDAEQSEQMALASNLPATRPRPSTQPATVHTGAAAAATELAHALTALVTCADLLTSGSTFSQDVAANLIKAEASRALGLLSAMRVLRDEAPVARARVSVRALLEHVAANGSLERKFRDVRLRVDSPGASDALVIHGNPQLLADALAALISVAGSLTELAGTRLSLGSDRVPADDAASVVVTVAAAPAGAVTFSVTHKGVDIPPAWLARPFDIAWPLRSGAASLVRLQAARRVAHSMGGDVQVEQASDGTVVMLTLPLIRDEERRQR